jgi:hypothetical protein
MKQAGYISGTRQALAVLVGWKSLAHELENHVPRSALDRLGLVDLGIQATVQPENPYILTDTPGKSAKVSQPTLHRLLHFKTSGCLAQFAFLFFRTLYFC